MNRQELMSLDPEQLCEAYRQQLVRVYGPERAEASRVDHDKGWYYTCLAVKYQDGSIGLGGRIPTAIRKRVLVERVLNLAQREPVGGDKHENLG